jgi:hypothetical protein
MAYITRDSFKQSLASLLGKASPDLLAVDDTFLNDCLRRGYLDIISRLAARSFTQAQIDAWDRREEFNLDLSLFWAFTTGGIPHAFDNERLRGFDRRKELEAESFRLLIANKPVMPGGDDPESAGGNISYGMTKLASHLPTTPTQW